jgi:hypothetical protein
MQVASLDTADLLEGGWREGCLLLVMPGGADLPYCKHLNGRGNALIRGGPLLLLPFIWQGPAGLDPITFCLASWVRYGKATDRASCAAASCRAASA